MAAYLTANRPIVIKQRKDGSVYLKQKISKTRYLVGFSILSVLLFILTQIIVYRVNAEKEAKIKEMERVTQLANLQNLAKEIALPATKVAFVGVPPPTKEDRMRSALIGYITSHYLISEKGADKIIQATIEASKLKGIEPSLVIAIIAIESGFNPYAKSKGNAEGLMQVIPYWHPEKMQSIGGTKNIIETRANIMAGTSTIKEYLNKFKDNKILALQQYAGALDDKKRKYSNAVLSEKRKIDSWISSKMV